MKIRIDFPIAAAHRLKAIDQLRGLALLLILFYHSGGMLSWNWTYSVHGEAGVDLFLIISGFGLALNCVDLPIGQFLTRRFLRIFPSYWVALALFVWLDVHYYADHRSTADLVLHILGLQCFSGTAFMSINQSFWFISLVVLCYGLFLLLRKKLENLSLLVTVCALTTLLCYVFYRQIGFDGGLDHFVVRIPAFFLGVAAAQFGTGRGVQFRVNLPLCASLLVIAYLGLNYGLNWFNLLLAGILTFLWLQKYLTQDAVGRFALGLLSLLGVYSYEIYLLHQPVMRSFSRVAMYYWFGIASPTTRQVFAGMAGGFLVSVAAAVVLHTLVAALFRFFSAAHRPGFARPKPG